MPKFAAGIVITIALLAVVAQLAMPAYYEGRVEDRLEQKGGSADVSIGAFPAVTLVGGRGKKLEATGEGLAFDLDNRREDPFGRLDGFEDVDLRLTDVEAGSIHMSTFELRRRGRDSEYALRVDATATPRELAQELGTAAGGPLGGLVGSLATDILPGAGIAEVPLEVTARVRSHDGRPDVTAAQGSVAGLPAGPLAEIVLGTVLDRL
jgi:hypothetical protein